MLVSNPFLSIVYQFGQAVMQDSWMRFLKFKNDVLVLSLMGRYIHGESVLRQSVSIPLVDVPEKLLEPELGV